MPAEDPGGSPAPRLSQSSSYQASQIKNLTLAVKHFPAHYEHRDSSGFCFITIAQYVEREAFGQKASFLVNRV